MSLALTTGKRKIKDGKPFYSFFPPESEAYGNYSVLDRNGTVEETVKFIADIIEKDKKDTRKISQYLKAPSRLKTLRKVHSFMVNYLQYDTEAGEKLRSPRRTWWVGNTENDKQTGDTGVDCDDLVIFSGSILSNLNIPFFIRIVKIDSDQFQHVYLIVPKSGNDLSNGYYTLDGVLSDFNYEYPYTLQNTFSMNGLKIEYLGNILPITTNDSDPIFNWLDTTYRAIVSGKESPKRVNKADIIKMLGYALKNWDTNRLAALKNLADTERTKFPGHQTFQQLYKTQLKLDNYGLGALNGDWMPSDWTAEDEKLLDTPVKVTDYKQKIDWNNIVNSVFSFLASKDWGISSKRANNIQPSPTPAYLPPQQQTGFFAKYQIPILVIVVGGTAFLLWDSKQKGSSRKSTNKRIG